MRATRSSHPTTRTRRTPRSPPTRRRAACASAASRPDEERRLLFTYDPFRDTVDLPLPGPIFIHEGDCPRYDAGRRLPARPARERASTFNAYGADRTLVARERTESAAEVDGAIDRLLADDGVEYVHVRSTSAGCFLCRLDQTPA